MIRKITTVHLGFVNRQVLSTIDTYQRYHLRRHSCSLYGMSWRPWGTWNSEPLGILTTKWKLIFSFDVSYCNTLKLNWPYGYFLYLHTYNSPSFCSRVVYDNKCDISIAIGRFPYLPHFLLFPDGSVRSRKRWRDFKGVGRRIVYPLTTKLLILPFWDLWFISHNLTSF